jgi:asparagine synthase (glutamine-hydrolysing)
MSGLAVRFHRDGCPMADTLVWPMLHAIPYRGIDGMWIRSWESVALGFAKLTITPEEVHEQQPLVSPRTGCAIIADVRLDNRADLLCRLPGRLPAASSDADLILHAYETWDIEAVHHLLGDFAFVIWDPRDQRLVCARDTSGQRALFYRLDHAVFIAASEIQQLFQDPALPIEPNDERIFSFLTPHNMFRNEQQEAMTFYKDVYLLPPGHVLTISRSDHHLWQYWEFQPSGKIRYRHDDDYVEHFRALMFDVTQCRLRSIHPVGVLLSGGLDSSSVVCTAQDLYRAAGADDGGMTSFSVVFDGLDCDERPYIESIRSKYGFDMRYLPAQTFGGRLQPEPRGFLEGPNMGVIEEGNAMFGAVQAAGVRALLTGDVADGCVGGSWLIFDSLLRQGRLRELYDHIQVYRREMDPSWTRVALYTAAPLLPLALQRQVMLYRTRRRLRRMQHLLLPAWMPEALRSALADRAAQRALAAERERRFANETLHWESGILYPPSVARYPAPWSLSIWRPFADRRLHEFLFAIPPEQKFATHPRLESSYARSKWILRRAMAGIVPDEIRLRATKTVFGEVSSNEIQRQWQLYASVFGPDARSELAERGYVDPAAFWGRLQEAREQVQGNDMVYLMQMIGLETWLRTFRLPRSQRVTVPGPFAVQPPSTWSGAMRMSR